MDSADLSFIFGRWDPSMPSHPQVSPGFPSLLTLWIPASCNRPRRRQDTHSSQIREAIYGMNKAEKLVVLLAEEKRLTGQLGNALPVVIEGSDKWEDIAEVRGNVGGKRVAGSVRGEVNAYKADLQGGRHRNERMALRKRLRCNIGGHGLMGVDVPPCPCASPDCADGSRSIVQRPPTLASRRSTTSCWGRRRCGADPPTGRTRRTPGRWRTHT